MIAVRQLDGRGEVFTEFVGVRVESAFRWIVNCGFGSYIRESELVPFRWPPDTGEERLIDIGPQSVVAPLRLTLRGRTWIEDVDRPAVIARRAA